MHVARRQRPRFPQAGAGLFARSPLGHSRTALGAGSQLSERPLTLAACGNRCFAKVVSPAMNTF